MPNTAGELTDFVAFHNHQPPEPAKLIVTGRVTFPTGGYRVELRAKQDGEGQQVRKLHLERIVHPPEGAATQAFQTLDVRYEQVTDTEYEQVLIHPDGLQLAVEDVF